MLEVKNLAKTFDAGRKKNAPQGDRAYAVEEVSLVVEKGDFFTLLGPSGCGKTTTLRCIAGLEEPTVGSVTLGDRVLFDSAKHVNVPANRRNLGMVFQSYAIWPHMTVYKNVSFPLEVARSRSKNSGQRRIDEREEVMRVLRVTELDRFADRPATALSGGQQQRLALARAMVTQPDVLLLDEPLSNLDAKLREAMRFELQRLQHDLGLTIVYVTHDQAEALAMSTKVAVMNAGRIEQLDKPEAIYTAPASRFVADFIGANNFLPGTVLGSDRGMTTVDLGHTRVQSSSNLPVTMGQRLTVAIRPESFHVTELSDQATNLFDGPVIGRAFLGDSVDYLVRIEDTELRVRLNPRTRVASDGALRLMVDPGDVILLPDGAAAELPEPEPEEPFSLVAEEEELDVYPR